MNLKKRKRTLFLPSVRITPAELSILREEFKGSFQASFSDFVRHKLMSKKISEAHQRKFDAYIKIGNLRQELNSIGVNINQIAKRMNTYDEKGIIGSDRKMLAALREQLALINTILNRLT